MTYNKEVQKLTEIQKARLESREDGYKEMKLEVLRMLNDDSMSRQEIISQLDSPSCRQKQRGDK
jgi:hypothetical protein